MWFLPAEAVVEKTLEGGGWVSERTPSELAVDP
jgi:hypothetical protein